MKREDLFAAIGEVEESRLARSEMTVQPSVVKKTEGTDMNNRKRSTSRMARNLLIAAVLVSMLALTAFASVGYLLYDSPAQLLAHIFGNETGYDRSDGAILRDPQGGPEGILVEPTFERVPADDQVVQEDVAPFVSPVGQSISWEGYTLTIDANLYDAATKCGLVTYVLENPDGLNYDIQSDGHVWFPGGEVLDFGQYGYSYIIQDQSTDTKLAATYYYQLRDTESTDLVISFSQWAGITREEINQRVEEIKQELRKEIPEEEALAFQMEYVGADWPWFEANRTREENIDSAYEVWAYERLEEILTCPDSIIISENKQSEMTSITAGDAAITISPIAVTVRVQEIENLSDDYVDLIKIQFVDATEYVVVDGYILNHVFAVSDAENTETTYMFNRIIDVDAVAAIVINGREVPVN